MRYWSISTSTNNHFEHDPQSSNRLSPEAAHGPKWIKPFSEESGYNYTSVWRFANNITEPVTRRMELEIERLKSNGQKLGE